MRGLLPDERTILARMAGDGPDHWLDPNDVAGEEVRDRLVAQGRLVSRIVAFDEENDAICWEITALGKLALKVCGG